MSQSNWNNIAIIVSAIAGILLAVLANWIYDVLRRRNILPNNPKLKMFLYVTLGSCPFIFLVALPQILQVQYDFSVSEDKLANNVSSTQVIEYIPDLPKRSKLGKCWTSSLTLSRSTAWRCMIEHRIYDPCFELINPFESKENPKIVCNADPYHSEESFIVELQEPLPDPEKFAEDSLDNKEPDNAWILELSDGRLCYFNTGATMWRYERLNYFCDSKNSEEETFIMGLPTTGVQWRAYTVVLSKNRELVKNEWVNIKRVWR